MQQNKRGKPLDAQNTVGVTEQYKQVPASFTIHPRGFRQKTRTLITDRMANIKLPIRERLFSHKTVKQLKARQLR